MKNKNANGPSAPTLWTRSSRFWAKVESVRSRKAKSAGTLLVEENTPDTWVGRNLAHLLGRKVGHYDL